MEVCRQTNVSTFSYAVLVRYSVTSKDQVCFNFMAAVTMYSDFGA